MNEVFEEVENLYTHGYSMKEIAHKLGFSEQKVRKILITLGLYTTSTISYVNEQFQNGVPVDQIANELSVGRNTVMAMLPYSKVVYGLSSPSANAAHLRRFREKQKGQERMTEGDSHANRN